MAVVVSLVVAGCATTPVVERRYVPLDESLVVLFADLHLTEDANNPHQRAGFAECVREVLGLNPLPANVLMFGDLSFDHGDPGDYRLLKQMVRPLEEAGIRWHACLGNHDRRRSFQGVFPERRSGPSLVDGRLVTVVTTPHADFILVDSCLEGPVNGAIDEAQRAWLRGILDDRKKPVFVGAHHPLVETGLSSLLASNNACVGYVFGHHHAWRQQREAGVETLCLPSTGHWGDIGYVLVRLDATGATFTLRQRDYYTPRPARTPEEAKPGWRERAEKNDGREWRVPFRAAGTPVRGQPAAAIPLAPGRQGPGTA